MVKKPKPFRNKLVNCIRQCGKNDSNSTDYKLADRRISGGINLPLLEVEAAVFVKNSSKRRRPVILFSGETQSAVDESSTIQMESVNLPLSSVKFSNFRRKINREKATVVPS